jgi:hypothetical protein
MLVVKWCWFGVRAKPNRKALAGFDDARLERGPDSPRPRGSRRRRFIKLGHPRDGDLN